MKKLLLPVLTFLFLNCCYAQQQFQVAPPMLKYGSSFFTAAATASLKFAQAGTQIFYTLNGKEPTQKDLVYQSPIIIKKSLTTLKAKVFGNGFLPSETVQVTFIKDGLKIKSVEASAPNEKYPGDGTKTLFDNQGGMADMHSKNFMGYQQDSVEFDVTLEKKQKVKSVLIDFLQNNGSWIFLPQNIRVYYFNKNNNSYQLFGTKDIAVNKIANGSSCVYEIVKADNKITADKLKIIITPLQVIPEDHPAKGKQSWLFIDEIKIY